MGSFVTKFKPSNCTSCSFSKPYTSDDMVLVMRCEKTGRENHDPDKTVLDNCPLPCEGGIANDDLCGCGCSEEEYCCCREKDK